MSEPTIVVIRFIALSTDVAKAFNSAHPNLSNASAVHVVLSDQREFVVVEAGETFEIEHAGHVNQLGEAVLVFKVATTPLSITDAQIREQQALYQHLEDTLAAATGSLRVVDGLRMPLIPEVVRHYLRKSVEEQRQWIEFDASTDEWNEFLTALQAAPEPEKSMVWTFYVMRPHSEVVRRRHPSRPPRGSA